MARKITTWVIALGVLGYGSYAIATAPKISQGEILSHNGLHWHAHMTIKIKGENIPIPSGIGSTGVMGTNGEPMELHTHETDGIVHAELGGVVTKEQLKLKHFFEVWMKDFSRESILGHKTGEGGTVRMFVDGKENFEFENYSINGANDRIEEIEIVYE